MTIPPRLKDVELYLANLLYKAKAVRLTADRIT